MDNELKEIAEAVKRVCHRRNQLEARIREAVEGIDEGLRMPGALTHEAGVVFSRVRCDLARILGEEE